MFDTLNRNILNNKLVAMDVHKARWMAAFLPDSEQKVRTGDAESQPSYLKEGIPNDRQTYLF